MDQKNKELFYSLTVPSVLFFLLFVYCIINYNRRELPNPIIVNRVTVYPGEAFGDL